MRILMLGDYSNLHACLADELKRRGHTVTLVSDGGGYMKTKADLRLIRKPGFIGAVRYLLRIIALLPSWRNYDVVQLINPGFFKLRAGKLKAIFKVLKRQNRSIFLTLCGNDHYFVKDCLEAELFRFSEFKVGNDFTEDLILNPWKKEGWMLPEMASQAQHLYQNIDGAMAVLPEYYMSAARYMDNNKLFFTNLPIRLSQLEYKPLQPGRPLKVTIGMKAEMAVQKGTARVLDICREIERENPGLITVDAISGLPLDEYLQRLKSSDIIIDQLYSYSPGTNAYQTMALGRVSATGWQPECGNMLGVETPPVIMLAPDIDIKQTLLEAFQNPARLIEMSAAGRRLVEKENDVAIVADRFLKHWNHVLSAKS